MAPDDLSFVDSAQAGTAANRQFYREVLATSFRPDELATEAEMIAGLCEPSDDMVATLATAPDGRVLGGIVANWFPASRVLLLSYLAVRSGRRGGGVGSRLAAFAVPGWIRRFGPELAIGEVEDPLVYASDGNYGDGSARLRLYGRFGAQALPLDYFQPALGPGRARVPHLLLLCFFVAPGALVAPGRVDGRVVERFLREYFTATEGPTVDAQLHRLLAACLAPDGLLLTAADRTAADAGSAGQADSPGS